MQPRVAILAIILTLASTTVLAETEDKVFQTAWEAAEAVRQQAASVGHEWRDTAQMLEQAKALAAEGDYQQAMKLVINAKMQGEQGVAQAKEQSSLWQDAVPK